MEKSIWFKKGLLAVALVFGVAGAASAFDNCYSCSSSVVVKPVRVRPVKVSKARVSKVVSYCDPCVTVVECPPVVCEPVVECVPVCPPPAPVCDPCGDGARVVGRFVSPMVYAESSRPVAYAGSKSRIVSYPRANAKPVEYYPTVRKPAVQRTPVVSSPIPCSSCSK